MLIDAHSVHCCYKEAADHRNLADEKKSFKAAKKRFPEEVKQLKANKQKMEKEAAAETD
jgi:hypothetical protein